jgi:hypothetical protein
VVREAVHPDDTSVSQTAVHDASWWDLSKTRQCSGSDTMMRAQERLSPLQPDCTNSVWTFASAWRPSIACFRPSGVTETTSARSLLLPTKG